MRLHVPAFLSELQATIALKELLTKTAAMVCGVLSRAAALARERGCTLRARLTEAAPAPLVRSSRAVWLLIRDAAYGWSDHQASRTGAALAFYTVFSLGPILLLSIAIAGFFFGQKAARGEIFEQISDLVGPAGAAAVQSVLRHAGRPGAGLVPTIISVITLILGANTALVELKSGLDQIWNVPPERRQGFWYFVRTRLLSVGMILALGFLLLVSLVASAALAALEKLSHGEQLFNLALDYLNSLLSFVLVAALFALIYRVLPSVRIAWRDVTIGAFVTALLFTIGKFGIGAYIGNSSLASTYGAAGSLIVLLLWVYYSAQIFLFGAEFTRSYAYRFGSHRHEIPAKASVANTDAHPADPPTLSAPPTTPARAQVRYRELGPRRHRS